MTKEETEKRIKEMQAFAEALPERLEMMRAFIEGKPIEILFSFNREEFWTDCPNPGWDWDRNTYRIKPEWTPQREERVLVRDIATAPWKEAIFSFYEDGETPRYYTVGGLCWRFCAPFDINKLGTV